MLLDMARLVQHISFALRSMCLQGVLAARVGQGEVKGSQPACRRSVRGGPKLLAEESGYVSRVCEP